MKKRIVFVFSIFGSIFSNAQSPAFDWAAGMGGISYEIGYAIATDNAGNVYTTGEFNSYADFNPGAGTSYMAAVGGSDIFIQKLDASGNFAWVKSIGNGGADRGYGIAIDVSGNIYLTGSFENTVDFDPGPGTFNLISAGSQDVFILKLDTSGNFLWAKSFGQTSFDLARGIVIDALGNSYITGSYSGTVDFDPGAGSFYITSSGLAGFIEKLDASGNFVWAKSMDGFPYSIAIDDAHNVFTTGFFAGTVDFDTGPGVNNITSAGYDDIFVHKLDAAGNFDWVKTFGGLSSDQAYGITIDPSGNIAVTGMFAHTVDFDPGSGVYNLTAPNFDIFVFKLDTAGGFMWAKMINGANASDSGNSIVTDNNGAVYVTGEFYGVVDFDPGLSGSYMLTGNGDHDAYVLKLDSAGNFAWAVNVGGISLEEGHSIAVDPGGNVLSTGEFHQTADFDPGAATHNLVSGGNSDIYILKLRQIPAAIYEHTASADFEIFPNPSDGHFYLDLKNNYPDVKIEIADITGRIISSTEMTGVNSIIPFDLTGPAGAYFVFIYSDKYKAAARVIKN